MNIAFFDFDGTITTRDSFPDFLLYAAGYLQFAKGLLILSPMLLAYELGVIPNWRTKEIVLRHFFKDWDLQKFTELASRYARERLPHIIRETSLKQIYRHQAAGDKVVVVTAAIDCWLKDWCNSYGLELLATRLEVRNGKLTGRLAGKNCYGPEKVKRIKENYRLEDYRQIFAYGDSPGDREMLALAHCPHLVSGTRLKQI